MSFIVKLSVYTCVYVCVRERVRESECVGASRMGVMLSAVIFPSPKTVLEKPEMVESVDCHPHGRAPPPDLSSRAFDRWAGLVKISRRIRRVPQNNQNKTKVCRRSQEMGHEV